jgi:hypothetical protein
MRYAGHCFRAESQPIHRLVFKNPENYFQGKGVTLTYVQAIRKDIVKIIGGAYHLKDLTTDKNSRCSQGKIIKKTLATGTNYYMIEFSKLEDN